MNKLKKLLKPELELRRKYNQGKKVVCCKYSYDGFKKEETDSIDVQVAGEWIRYKPKTQKQIKKARFYTNYNFTVSPFVQEQQYRDKTLK